MHLGGDTLYTLKELGFNLWFKRSQDAQISLVSATTHVSDYLSNYQSGVDNAFYKLIIICLKQCIMSYHKKQRSSIMILDSIIHSL